ncbi:MAG TPA: Gfo/Idh/MocA family oxidoreductase [Acidimicrobiales bacterium]|nr:Gfo/Idh/MocA family oxidoreductase [Acidimicrobiales bacterium]
MGRGGAGQPTACDVERGAGLLTLRVGLAGAGPWARCFHAPMLSRGPHTSLSAIWSRNAESARLLAKEFGARAVDRYEDLVESSDAVSICVAPEAQAPLAISAARAGRAILLEKPLSDSVRGAEQIVEAVESANVGSMLMLSYRFSPRIEVFVRRARELSAQGGAASFISAAFLSGPFAAAAWRRTRGPLLDVGFHVLDLLDATLGPIADIEAASHGDGPVCLMLSHAGGAVSQVVLNCSAAVPRSEMRVELWGRAVPGRLSVRLETGAIPSLFSRVASEFARAARRQPIRLTGPLPDAARGLTLQRLVGRAEEMIGPGPMAL